tara:strand:- start:254 stop:466 length:213 start_codon:yes stop_codon:yes gene_type:complete
MKIDIANLLVDCYKEHNMNKRLDMIDIFNFSKNLSILIIVLNLLLIFGVAFSLSLFVSITVSLISFFFVD